mmetsp:Transcript_31993/g.68129  ORF Transcript_31993/g.68129 Transcript_31993/m.68129 type:complete len:92 (-) Transcript_31993:177-452(-)|eukprot:CAMPEP_0206453332 /NCGR_PEP_ID=MMETSP0324_2-20121206/20481_1 /ASSEMBLY_ACC=CAM_ASM_000836 /TAXON_ID=2866 /ORGANISM="Crypthecodinium cohnii, Strain Seligo" /LENGTH=91 /DNA_ID=CAMNT_0053923599 /DNA_START=34 /DNA_END=309 /DNA_ORIENTATION=-
MSTVFKRLSIGGKAAVFQAVKTYRPGTSTASSPAIAKMTLGEALASSKTKVTFLETETLKGLPVNKSLTTKTIDPYLASYIQDFNAAYFAK